MPAPNDEAFWQRQQKRREKQLGQPCCTQSGMSWTMIDMPGNFAVVIHGESDCLNCFLHHTGRSTHRIYSTRLTEEMLTTGRTEAQLRRCLRLIAEEERPELVLVLGTCPVEVIGDRFGPVVEAVSAETGVPMIPLRTSGLALSSQQQMLDWLFVTLAGLPPGPVVDHTWQREVALLGLEAMLLADAGPEAADALVARLRAVRAPGGGGPRVNLLGLPVVSGVVPEPVSLLAARGVEVNGTYPDGASLSDWRAIHHAAHTFVVDRTVTPRLVALLEERGQRVHEVPLPVGLKPSLRLYDVIAGAVGVDPAWPALDGLREAASRRLELARQRVGGARVGVTVRMLANYNAENLVYEGLGEVEALQEMGLDVHLFVQGPPEPEPRQRFIDQLRSVGCELPVDVFGGPWILPEHLRAAGCALAVTSDTVRNEARAAGIAFLPTRSLRPYVGGVAASCELVEGALAGRGA